MSNKPASNIVVISGPSGSGKTTLINRLMNIHPEIVFSTSHTTRPIRGAEVDGIDYHFVSKEQFLQMKDRDEFLEWAEVYGNYYGTSLKEIDTKINSGSDHILVLDIDVQGAINIRKLYPYALFVLVTPPSMKILRERLLNREQKFDRNIETRLEIANDELKQYDVYDYIVINDNLEDAFHTLNSIYIAFQNTTAKHEAFMKKHFSKPGR